MVQVEHEHVLTGLELQEQRAHHRAVGQVERAARLLRGQTNGLGLTPGRVRQDGQVKIM